MDAVSIELNRAFAVARLLGSCGVPRPSDRVLATAAVFAAALLWGTSFVAAKGALAAFPPVTLVLGERLTGLSLLGLMAPALGVAGVMLAGAADVGFAACGDALFLLGSANCAVYVVAARQAFAGGDLLATLVGMTRWGVLLLPVAGIELAAVGIGAPDTRSVLLLLYLGAGCSALSYALSAFGARHLEAGRRSVILNVEVPSGVAAGAVLLRERLAAGQVVAGLLIVLGAALAMPRALPPRPAAAAPPPAFAVEGLSRQTRMHLIGL